MLLGNYFTNIDNSKKKIFFSGISFNSKDIKKDNIFFAIKGNNFDGNKFISIAIKKGSKIIISEKRITNLQKDILFIHTKNIRKLLAEIAFKIYKNKPNNLIAVTGTNGKSSVSDFYFQLLNLNKVKVASIGTLGVKSKNFTKQIAFNAIPHIDIFSENGYTKEELKMTYETKKILDEKIELTATCVRLPISVSHCESVNLQFEKPFTLEKVREALNSFDGCKVFDERVDGGYFTPIEAEGKNETFISRIREDKTIKNGLNLWIVSDNLLRGAALNAVEIADTLIKNNYYGK